MAATESAVVTEARRLWATFRVAEMRSHFANVGLKHVKDSRELGLNISTASEYEASSDEVENRQRDYTDARAALDAFYADHFGSEGVAALSEYFQAMGALTDLLHDLFHFRAFARGGGYNADRFAAAATQMATEVPSCEVRLLSAQRKLDGLVGRRAN